MTLSSSPRAAHACLQTGTPSFPEQHLESLGIEAELKPRPQYSVPHYRGSGKLDGTVALIMGGADIGRAITCEVLTMLGGRK